MINSFYLIDWMNVSENAAITFNSSYILTTFSFTFVGNKIFSFSHYFTFIWQIRKDKGKKICLFFLLLTFSQYHRSTIIKKYRNL
jgi:hypothetical protein